MSYTKLSQIVLPTQHARGVSASKTHAKLFVHGKGKCFLGDVAILRQDKRACVSNSISSSVIEANLFSRMGRVIKSYANSLVSSAEDPEKLLDQTVIEMQEDLVKMRQASAQVMASQKQMENKYKQAQTTADDWYRRAQLALKKGDEDLARQALSRRKTFQDNADGLKQQLASQQEATKSLVTNTRTLETKLAEARSKKDTLKARAASAKTSKQVSEMVGGLSTSNATSAFDRMEEKVIAMEADAEATSVIAGSDALAQEFAMLEDVSVDDELDQLKKSLAPPSKPSKGELPEGRPVKEAIMDSLIDAELEELRRKARE